MNGPEGWLPPELPGPKLSQLEAVGRALQLEEVTP